MECILTADTGSGYNEQYLVAKSIQKLIQQYPKIQAVILAGDNIYPNGCSSIDDKQFISLLNLIGLKDSKKIFVILAIDSKTFSEIIGWQFFGKKFLSLFVVIQ